MNVSTALIRPIGEKATTDFMPHEIAVLTRQTPAALWLSDSFVQEMLFPPSLVSAQNQQRCSSVDLNLESHERTY
jgi:hypothetical protein